MCNDLPWPRVFAQQRQSLSQNLTLQLAHKRPARTIANLKSLRIQRSRRSHLCRNLGTYGNQDRWDSFHLNLSLDRYDRAVANIWSTPCQNHRVSARPFVDLIGNLTSGALVHRLELHSVAHIPDVLFGDSLNKLLGLQISKHINWKHDVDVLVSVGVIIVMMGDLEPG